MASELIGPDRLPPQNRDAERSVLGSMLRDNEVIDVVAQIVTAESFYLDAHRKIFQAISDLHDKGGQPVDLVILAEELIKRGQLEDVGRATYLADLWDAAPTAANAEYYAKIVRDKAIVRQLIHASTEILRDAYDQGQLADELLEGAERRILDVAQMGISGQTITLEQAITETYRRIDDRVSGKQKAGGLSTGFVDLNEITAGLHDGELIIIAARPSVGKTAFSLAIVRNVIVDEKEPVFFVSLEQSRIELAERLLCSQARVDSHRLRKGTLGSDDMDRLIDAGGELRTAKLFIDDSPVQSMLRIAANARRLKLRQGIKLIVVDYLQLIEPDNRRDPRQEQVAQVSRRLKALAKELQIPLIALAQVNRSSEDRQDHRPRLADLRESGCLAGETLITLADTGERVPLRNLVGKSGFDVWALDECTMKLKPATVSNAFATGKNPVFRLTTRLGRSIRATANHKFRAFRGWCRLDALQPGDCIALPRIVPCGSSSSMSKRPSHREVFRSGLLLSPSPLVGEGWGGGCGISQHLPPTLTLPHKGGGDKTIAPTESRMAKVTTWRAGGVNPLIVASGGLRPPLAKLFSLAEHHNPANRAPGAETKQNVSRERLARVNVAVGGDSELAALASSDVYWDRILSIEPDGEEQVYDLTVPGPSNFVANSIFAHNSIEQDADTVMLLHRPDRYEPGQQEGITEVIIGKQRNGPTGEVTLAYLKQYMRYEDYAPGTPFDS